MKTLLLFLTVLCISASAWAQQDTTLPQASFVIRYRPLIIWNGIGLGYYLHPNHSIELYGTGQATIELLDAQLVLERSVILEYRYYAINRQKTRWFVAPYFKHGRGDITHLFENYDYDPDQSQRQYLKDNGLGAIIGFQFNIKPKRKGKSYGEVFAGPQYIFRTYYSRADLYTGLRQTSQVTSWGFVRFGVNFCYDFYRKNR